MISGVITRLREARGSKDKRSTSVEDKRITSLEVIRGLF